MALKPLRYTVDDTIEFFWGSSAAERGGIASIVTGGSGEALDNSSAVVGYRAQAAGDTGINAGSGFVPMGVLMNDVVSIDQTRQHLNQFKDEVQVNSKVTLLKRGVVNTNMIVGAPTAGHKAYLGDSGTFTATQLCNEAPIVGRFLSSKDHNAYAKVHVDLPNSTIAPPLTSAD